MLSQNHYEKPSQKILSNLAVYELFENLLLSFLLSLLSPNPMSYPLQVLRYYEECSESFGGAKKAVLTSQSGCLV